MEYPSKLVENAVNEIAKLPGIGKKTALRLVLHLLRQEEEASHQLAGALVNLRTNIKYCKKCHNLSDGELCGVCADKSRDQAVVCVVGNASDVLAIENTSQYRGLYHVLGGVISPIEGVGPGDLKIDELVQRATAGEVQEVILALNSTMEADTTAFYISRKLQGLKVKISTIARGVPVGGELEYTDEVTLGRSILRRVAYE